MAVLPKQNRIQKIMESGEIEQSPRTYLGYSQMGARCHRQLYYYFRWAFKTSIDKRVSRIFERGHLEEPRIIQALQKEGFRVYNCEKEIIGIHKHIKGHIDGMVSGLPDYISIHPVLLEIKTMNNKRFKDYLNRGLQKSNPSYYSQIMSYMGKLKINSCLYVVHNKDTEERSWKIIDFDNNEFERIEHVCHKVLYSEFVPKKIGESTWFECKFCAANNICHKGAKIEKNCRTCKHVAIAEKGQWECNNDEWHEIHCKIDIPYSNSLSDERQELSCFKYELDTEAFCV